MTSTDRRAQADYDRMKVVIDDDLANRSGNWDDDIAPWIHPTVLEHFATLFSALMVKELREDADEVEGAEGAEAVTLGVLTETIHYGFIRAFLFGARFRAATEGHRKP